MAFLRSLLPALSLCALMFSTSAVSAPQDLEEAERILQECPSLKAFLENAELQQRYSEAIRRYLGPKVFPGEFDQRINYLKRLLPTVPELEQRLWAPDTTGVPFELRSQAKTYARDIAGLALKEFFERWKDDYLIEATPYVLKQLEEKNRPKEMANRLERMIETHLANVTKAKIRYRTRQ